MKKASTILACLGLLSVALLAGCQKEETPTPPSTSSVPAMTNAPAATNMPAAK